MKKQLTLMIVGCLVVGAATASAADRFDFLRLASQPTLLPAPAYQEQPGVPPAPAAEGVITDPAYTPAPAYTPVPAVQAQPVALYHRVKYKDMDEMHPCAVPKIIAVQDPCPTSCCGPQCVYIQICVPPCACEDIRSRRNGTRVRYDYGKYAVDVRVKRGYIEVDYQD